MRKETDKAKRTALVVAAHPDDEVLGCGGTIARLAEEGHVIFVAILGEGITSRYERRKEADKMLVRGLRDCSRKVGDLLGIKDLFFFDLPDNRFDTVPLLDVVKIIEKLVKRLRPEIVYTHHVGDLNVDHSVVHKAVLTATRPLPGHPVREVYAFEIPSSTEWAFGQYQQGFWPNVFVEISATLTTKIRAIALYESETEPFPHPRSPKAIKSIATRWGSVAGLKAAEAFVLLRSIW